MIFISSLTGGDCPRHANSGLDHHHGRLLPVTTCQENLNSEEIFDTIDYIYHNGVTMLTEANKKHMQYNCDRYCHEKSKKRVDAISKGINPATFLMLANARNAQDTSLRRRTTTRKEMVATIFGSKDPSKVENS
jgi:hypothetical protein